MDEGARSSAQHVMRGVLNRAVYSTDAFVHALRRKGGWEDGSNRAWENGPVTSEQFSSIIDNTRAHEHAIEVASQRTKPWRRLERKGSRLLRGSLAAASYMRSGSRGKGAGAGGRIGAGIAAFLCRGKERVRLRVARSRTTAVRAASPQLYAEKEYTGAHYSHRGKVGRQRSSRPPRRSRAAGIAPIGVLRKGGDVIIVVRAPPRWERVGSRKQHPIAGRGRSGCGAFRSGPRA